MKTVATLALALACSGVWAADAADPPIKAVTAPSKDLVLAFTLPGRIESVLVREGQDVTAGQLLVQLDRSVEQKQLELLKANADNDTPLKVAQLEHSRKEALFEQVRKAYDANAAPERELEDAKLEVQTAELKLKQVHFERRQAERRHEEAALILQRMQLRSPIDGEVERIVRRAGEAVTAQDPLLRVVRTDPLWIDVPAPLARARAVADGQTALVRFGDEDAPVRAKVIRVSHVADAASETLEIRLELPNPTGRPAGEQVTVRFPPDKAPSPDKAPG